MTAAVTVAATVAPMAAALSPYRAGTAGPGFHEDNSTVILRAEIRAV